MRLFYFHLLTYVVNENYNKIAVISSPMCSKR